jgi:hypothetical protein
MSNPKADGYRGLWYMNQPSFDEYVFKYSGGLGTYCAKHQPFAVYRPEVDKTFFCYGGAPQDDHQRLHHMVSYYDHATDTVPRPTVLLDKETDDAHDNPVISIDDRGYVWIFSTSHGRTRPSYIHKSRRPYGVEEFVRISATRRDGPSNLPIDNFSYMQPWHVPGVGFVCFFTRYDYPAKRTSCFMTSPDGVTWSAWTRLAAIHEGHYQVSAVGRRKAGAAFNYHPVGKGLNWRTNLYYVETEDWGRTWQNVRGEQLLLPLLEPENPALVHDYAADGLNVYLKDILYDQDGRPVILFLTSGGYQSGPQNAPRTWTTAHWTGQVWEINPGMTSDSNYDMGSLYLEGETWRIIGPTETGPQAHNPGGEVVMWTSTNRGGSWEKVKQLTRDSRRNHTYVRRPLDAHPGFYAFWADGDARKPSASQLYFCDRAGSVRTLPPEMDRDLAVPGVLI